MSERSENGTSRNSEVHLDEDLCLDLLNGLLSPEERQKALAHIENCPSCETFVQARVSELEKSRSQIDEVRERLARDIRRSSLPAGSLMERIFASVRRSFGRRPVRIGVGVAAAIIVLLLFIPPLFEPSYDPELIMLPDISADLKLRADEESGVSGGFAYGLAAYERRDFSSAVTLLRNAEVTELYTTYKDIYLGSALAWNGRYEEALNVLQPLSEEVLPEPWGNGYRWTCFVALYKSGNITSADSLAHLLAHENDVIGERARQYLSR